MGRLIDADVLEEFIKTHSCCVGTDGELLTVGEDGKWNNLLEYIPTAYDVDKVAKELKCDRCESCSLLEVCAGSKWCGECHNKVIEIVKQGGVSDDVCEWKEDAYGRWHTDCNTLADNNPLEYTYCPYCGKKIRRVE